MLLIVLCSVGCFASPRLVRTPSNRSRADLAALRARALAASAEDGGLREGGEGGGVPLDGDGDGESASRRRVLRPANVGPDDTFDVFGRSLTMAPTSQPTIEMEGEMAPPLLVPASGAYDAAVGLTFLHPVRGARVHYTTDGSAPTRASPETIAGAMLHLSATYSLSRVVRCFARAPDSHVANGDSTEAVAVYEIQMGAFDFDRSAYSGRVGVAYLVPYYHGRNFADISPAGGSNAAGETDFSRARSSHSAKMVSVDCATDNYRSVRIHGIETDFAEFYTFDDIGSLLSLEVDPTSRRLVVQRGTGPYTNQVKVHDLAAYENDDALRGFFHGFVHKHARRNATVSASMRFSYPRRYFVNASELTRLARDNEACEVSHVADPLERWTNQTSVTVESRGFLAPFFEGSEYSGKAVRLLLGSMLERVETHATLLNNTRCCAINASEFCLAINATTAYGGTVSIETTDTYHANATQPEKNAENATETRSQRNTETIDLAAADDRLRGFVGGFASGDYAYFVPHFDGRNPGHVVARVHATNASAPVEFLDLWDVDKSLAGFFGGFAFTSAVEEPGAQFGFLVPHSALYGPVGGVNTELAADGWAYSTPNDEIPRVAVGGDHTTERFHGKLVRIRLDNFTADAANVDVLDLTRMDPSLRGFAGGVVVGRYGLLVPYKNREGDEGYFGQLVRVDLETFRVDKVLDLTRFESTSTTTEIRGASLVGFVGAAAYGKYAVLVPHRNGLRSSNYNMRSHSSLVVRVDMNDFSLASVRVVDVAHVIRQQIPSIEDNELRGFLFGFCAGEHVYLAPHFSRDFYGKLVRIDMRDFDHLAHLQATDQSTEVEVGTAGAFYGVQYVDLERVEPELVGFSGGFSIRSAEEAVVHSLDASGQAGTIKFDEWSKAVSRAEVLQQADSELEPSVDESFSLVRTSIWRTCEAACETDADSEACGHCAGLVDVYGETTHDLASVLAAECGFVLLEKSTR